MNVFQLSYQLFFLGPLHVYYIASVIFLKSVYFSTFCCCAWPYGLHEIEQNCILWLQAKMQQFVYLILSIIYCIWLFVHFGGSLQVALWELARKIIIHVHVFSTNDSVYIPCIQFTMYLGIGDGVSQTLHIIYNNGLVGLA